MYRNRLYSIEKILGRKRIKGKISYKIKWENYPMNQCTWEPLHHLKYAKDLVEKYDKSHPFRKDLCEDGTKCLKKLLRKKRKIKNNSSLDKKSDETNENKTNTSERETHVNDKLDENDIKNNGEYFVDKSIIQVLAMKKINNNLMTAVEMFEDGKKVLGFISAKDLRIKNPFALLDFYEERIKFKT